MENFKALRIFEENGKIATRIVEATLDELDPGEVVIRAAYSSVNYKDALAGTGAGKIIRRFPLIGGIDVAGTVVSSSEASIKAGDAVICTSYDFGVAHDGGFAQYVRVPAAWVVPLPAGLTLEESMCLGTAGYTAGLAVQFDGAERPRAGQRQGARQRGDRRRRESCHRDARGARLRDYRPSPARIRSTSTSRGSARPKSSRAIPWRWARNRWKKRSGQGRSIPSAVSRWHGSPAPCGYARGDRQHRQCRAARSCNTTVFPFILRGVRLIGVDSVNTRMPLRRKIWRRLGGDLKPRHLAEVVQYDRIGRGAGRVREADQGAGAGQIPGEARLSQP